MADEHFSRVETEVISLRMNQIIKTVTNDSALETIVPALTRYEMHLYKKFTEESAEKRKLRSQKVLYL